MSFKRWPLYRSYSEDEEIPLMSKDRIYSLSLSPRLSQYRKWIIALALLCLILLIVITTFTVVLFVRTTDKDNSNAASSSTLDGTLPRWPSPSPSPLYIFGRAAVASDEGLCAEIGRNVMMKGGNAVDAIIATNICQGALNSESSGIGGSFFLSIYNKATKTCTTIDGRSVAGSAANQTMYSSLSEESSENGWLAAAVPGEVHGMKTAHDLFGKLAWRELFEPTIQRLRIGFPVSGHLAWVLGHQSVVANLNKKTGLDIFINPSTKQPYQQGEIMRRSVLADTLEELANSTDPIRLFYNSSMTDTMISEMKDGGILTRKDYASYTSKVYHSPVTVQLGTKHVMCGPPPPSSAGVIGAILKVLEHFDINPTVLNDFGAQSLMYHRIIEAFKFGFAARTKLGDPAFIPEANEVIKNITSEWWSDEVYHMITNHSLPFDMYGDKYFVSDDHGTTNMNAVDGDGNAAAITASVNSYFGCKRRSSKLGIIHNDDMDDFSQPARVNQFGFPPSPENFISPGKRPQSSMSPIIIFNRETGDVAAVMGGAGGSRIISAVAYVASRIIWLNETIKQAIDTPRLHNQFWPNVTYYESGFPEMYVSELENAFGQSMVKDSPREISVVTGISRTADGRLTANCDYRKEGGYPAGY